MATLVKKAQDLFSEIEGLDNHILVQLMSIPKGKTAVVVIKVNLPPGEMMRIPGVEYGIYVLTFDSEHNLSAGGYRPGRGEEAGRVALGAALMALRAMGADDPKVHHFTHNVVEA